ncbi:hypothetical protein E3N88_22772 [Mikania micrantha]|uniref:Uncharacterized protein n=1 Tax=Mikania micrantha TaxID=192012 RepID=A0A5N6NBE2_9ASTR|nr:hypothetical protein E3N88_22772 [Mikania micrantha]
MFPTIAHMRNLKTLKLRECSLKDGEIPSGIGELSNLKELDLSANDFSLLDFSISQLTCLKVLKLSFCKNLIELPDLLSSLVILTANFCMSLKTIRNYKWGKAIENCPMLLVLPGLEIPMGFTPPLLEDLLKISVTQVSSGVSSEDDVVWAEKSLVDFGTCFVFMCVVQLI